MGKFTEVPIEEMCLNPVTLISKDWWLITAGTEGSYNTMTAAWGISQGVWISWQSFGPGVKAAGSPPVFDDGTVYFAEAGLVLICRVIYHAPLVKEGFADPSMVTWNYLKKDFHEVYMGEILSNLKKQD